MSEMPKGWWRKSHSPGFVAFRVQWYRIERTHYDNKVEWKLLYREHPSLDWRQAYYSPYKRLKDAKAAAWEMDEHRLAFIKSESDNAAKSRKRHLHWARCSCGVELRHE